MLEKILKDKNIEKIINSINKVIIIDNCGCHGMNHALRVMKYIEIILKGIGSSKHEIELGKIAGYLHDIGAIEGKEGHAKRSSKFVQQYLTQLKFDNTDKDIIVHAIEDHSKGEKLKSNIGAALTFADKIDMFKDRMLRFKENNYFHENIKHMLNIELSVDDKNITVNIITDGNFDYTSLKDYPKMITKPTEMAKYLNRNCIFQVDNQIIDLYNIVTTKKQK